MHLQHQSPLFRLPAEIRNLIFALVLTADPGPQPYRAVGVRNPHVPASDTVVFAIAHPLAYPRIRGVGVLRTCERAYAEALPCLYDRTFALDEPCTLAVIAFLRAVGERGRACISRVEVGNFVSRRKGGWVDVKDAWELVAACVNLRSVRVRVRLDEYDMWELENGEEAEAEVRGRALAERMVSGHQAATLRGCKTVEVVAVSSLGDDEVRKLKAVVEPRFREVLMKRTGE